MTTPRALVLYAPGTNCHHETVYALERAGARAELVFLQNVLRSTHNLADCDILVAPGGFGFGDHLGAGRILAADLVHRCPDQLEEILRRGVMVLGICNGLQMLAETGLLGGDFNTHTRCVALDRNRSNRFEHWGNTQVFFKQPEQGNPCLWINGLEGEGGTLPVAHAEGRPVFAPFADYRVVATYGSPEGIAEYPVSPNGSSVAAICNNTGRIMGLMPHPERRVDNLHGGAFGLRLFQAGVRAA